MAEEGKSGGIEQKIEPAVRSRLQNFKDQADSLTLETVRRLLEKDLGLEKFALDAHKRFIRQCVEKLMDAPEDCSSTVETDADKDVHLSNKERPEHHEAKKDKKMSSTDDVETTEDSPIMGVLSPKSEAGVDQRRIEKAILERADHFLANSENITLSGVRRLLEEDLGLDKYALDPFKKIISQQIDKVMSPPKGAKSVKDVKKTSQSKKSRKLGSEEGPDSSGGESDKVEVKLKSRKEAAPRKIKKSEEPKKVKRSRQSDLDVSNKKQKNPAKRQKEEESDSGDDGSVSGSGQSGQSHLSIEKTVLRKENSAPVYGKKVEHLKSIIKACGMSVGPTAYKKAKQVPDDKREAFLLKELEGILSREGLSKNSSEKEIKDCRKRKETARELEGIDMSNIISNTRRRSSTFSFVSPVKSEVRGKGDKTDAKDSKKKKKNDVQNDDDKESEEKKEDEAEAEAEAEDKESEEKKVKEDEAEAEEDGGEGKKEDEAAAAAEEEDGGDDDNDNDDDDDGDDDGDDDESEEFNEDDNDESD